MSKLLLFGPTALEFYETVADLNFERTFLSAGDAGALMPTTKALAFLHRQLPHLSRPAHVTVLDRDHRRQKDARCHTASPSLAAMPLFRIGDGILVPLPEIALAQASRGLSVVEAAQRGSLLCSAFFKKGEPASLKTRTPLTLPSAIEEASRHCSDIPGCRITRSAIPWMLSHCASPREIALGLVLSLPVRLGGYGLPKPAPNFPIALGLRTRNLADRGYYVADFCWPERRLVVEYDSDTFHLSSDQHYHDVVKRTTLEAMGYRVITVSRRQLNSPAEMDKVGALIAKAHGRDFRFRVHDFKSRQASLWTVLGLTPH